MKYLNFVCKVLVITLMFTIALTQYHSALANTTYTLSGWVTNQSGIPLPDTRVDVIDPSTGTTVISTQTDASGSYSVAVEEGKYNIRVVPPAGSGLGSAIAVGRVVNNDTILDFVLVPVGSLTFSGRLVNAFGELVGGQRIGLAPAGSDTYIEQNTSALGEFSFSVTPGNYRLRMAIGSFTPNAPGYFWLLTENFALQENTVVDITLPAKRIRVTVQDPSGNPVPNTQLFTNTGYYYGGIDPGFSTNNAYSGYPDWASPQLTDENGQVTLWLFPFSYGSYTLTAIPPADMPYSTFNITNVTFTTQKDIVIILQFVHPSPVTTISLLESPNAAEEYPDPTTVSLSAIAAEGYEIESTSYRLDGGVQQAYTAPFTVSNGGPHTIEYWSVDNHGVFELPRTLDFNIVVNQPPAAEAGGPYTANEAEAITLDASSSTDPDNNITLFEWDLDSDGIYDTTGPTATVTFADDGVYFIALKVTDDYGEFDTDTAQITVENVLPVVHAGLNVLLNEGETFIRHASFTDPGADVWTATVNYGEGSGVEPLALDDDKTFALGHSYVDNDDYTIDVCVSDDDGGVGCDAILISVANVAPSIATFAAPIAPAQVETVIHSSATFTDPGMADTHTALWDWGDGTTSAGMVDGHYATASHSYETPGVYTLTLTLTDDDGGSDTETFQYVVIYDPSGGFVTGGGWINSPEGAYTVDPTLTGRATFGFVSKYQRGANIPTGNTEFQFHVAGMNFKSTSYDWLVVAGTKAQYKGTGKINNAGEYKFILTAVDGSPDKFRIKIWDIASGDVVYDNQLGVSDTADPTTAIQGGSIVVHRAR